MSEKPEQPELNRFMMVQHGDVKVFLAALAQMRQQADEQRVTTTIHFAPLAIMSRQTLETGIVGVPNKTVDAPMVIYTALVELTPLPPPPTTLLRGKTDA